MGTTIISVLLVSLCIVGISSLTNKQINTGLKEGQQLTEALKGSNFRDALRKVSGAVGPFFKVIGPFINMILNQREESQIIDMLKDVMEKIDNGFAKVHIRLSEIETQVRFNPTFTALGEFERDILYIVGRFKLLYQVSPSSRANRSILFIEEYTSSFGERGDKLYQMIKPSKFSNVGGPIMDYTANDRKKTQNYLRWIMHLLTQAAKIELAFLTLRDFHSNFRDMVPILENQIKEVAQIFENVDENVKNKYHYQSGIELDNYLAIYSDKHTLARQLAIHLTTKFYWRDWIVIVYPPVSGWNSHTISKCDGHHRFRKYGKNIFIASVEKTKPKMNLDHALDEISNVKLRVHEGWWKRERDRTAEEIHDALSDNGACATAVIKGGGIEGYSTGDRLTGLERYIKHTGRGGTKYVKVTIMQWG